METSIHSHHKHLPVMLAVTLMPALFIFPRRKQLPPRMHTRESPSLKQHVCISIPATLVSSFATAQTEHHSSGLQTTTLPIKIKEKKTPPHRQGEVFYAASANVARGFTSLSVPFIQRKNGHGLDRSRGRIVSHFQQNVSTRKSTEGITYLEMCGVIRKIHQHPLPCYKYLF